VKSLRDVTERHPGFEDRTPDLPPYPPLLPGEDPPPPTYDWVLPMLLGTAVAAVVVLLLFALGNAREAALMLSR